LARAEKFRADKKWKKRCVERIISEYGQDWSYSWYIAHWINQKEFYDKFEMVFDIIWELKLLRAINLCCKI